MEDPSATTSPYRVAVGSGAVASFLIGPRKATPRRRRSPPGAYNDAVSLLLRDGLAAAASSWFGLLDELDVGAHGPQFAISYAVNGDWAHARLDRGFALDGWAFRRSWYDRRRSSDSVVTTCRMCRSRSLAGPDSIHREVLSAELISLPAPKLCCRRRGCSSRWMSEICHPQGATAEARRC